MSSVRDLAIYIDADLVMLTQVTKTELRCFAALRQLRQVRRCVPASTFQSLVQALVISRFDYGNGVMIGLLDWNHIICSSSNWNILQSGYSQGHSTETALWKILDDIIEAADVDHITALVSLDISAAFHVVDHVILIQPLEEEFGISRCMLIFLIHP